MHRPTWPTFKKGPHSERHMGAVPIMRHLLFVFAVLCLTLPIAVLSDGTVVGMAAFKVASALSLHSDALYDIDSRLGWKKRCHPS